MQTINRQMLAGLLRRPSGGFGNSPGGWAGGAGSPVPSRQPRQMDASGITAYSAPQVPQNIPRELDTRGITAYSRAPGTLTRPAGGFDTSPGGWAGGAGSPGPQSGSAPRELDTRGITAYGQAPSLLRPAGGFGNSPGGWAGGAGSPVPARNSRPQQFPGQMPWAYNRT